MKKVPVDKIEADMVLAKEVRGRSGNVLLSKGAQLNPFIGRRLKNWEISFVHIEGDEDVLVEESGVTVAPEEIKANVEKKFAKVLHDPIMKQIFAAILQFRTQSGR